MRIFWTCLLALLVSTHALAQVVDVKSQAKLAAELTAPTDVKMPVEPSDLKLIADSLHLLGVWTSNCYNPAQITSSGQNIYVQDVYIFAASGNYTLESSHFSDPACSQPQGEAQNFFGEYRLGHALEDSYSTSLRRIVLTLDSTDWPAQMPAAQLQWVISFSKNKLFFGAFTPPTHTLTPGVWFEKNLSPNTSVFVF